MLIKHRSLVTRGSHTVNKALLAMAIAAAALSTSQTVMALPTSASINKTVHTVKFSRAELATATGMEAIYGKLTQEAKSACNLGRAVNQNGKLMTKAECTLDMLSQFVTSASIDALTDYHELNNYRVKTASLDIK